MIFNNNLCVAKRKQNKWDANYGFKLVCNKYSYRMCSDKLLYIKEIHFGPAYENNNSLEEFRNSFITLENVPTLSRQILNNNRENLPMVSSLLFESNNNKRFPNVLSEPMTSQYCNHTFRMGKNEMCKKFGYSIEEDKLSDGTSVKDISTTTPGVKTGYIENNTILTKKKKKYHNNPCFEPDLKNFTHKCNTIQRKSGKTYPQSSKPSKYRNSNLESRVVTNNHYGSILSTERKRKPKGKFRRQNCENSNSDINSNYQKITDSSRFTVKQWLQKDLQSYKRQCNSITEDNMILYDNHSHRNSTSSEPAASDDLNSNSSNDDLCLTYFIKNKSCKTDTKTLQKTPQKRIQIKKSSNTFNASVNHQLIDIDEEAKGNIKAKVEKQMSRCVTSSMRKQCTKSAAFKAVFNNNNNALSKMDCNSLSSASSAASVSSSVSSSASNSPTHSTNSSPSASPSACKRNTEYMNKSTQRTTPSLRQFIKLSMNEQQLIQQLRRYVIDPSLLRVYGFPVESIHQEGNVEIYKCLPKHLAEEAVTEDNQRHHRHFYGRNKSNALNIYDDLHSSSYNHQLRNNNLVDSGCGSCDSSPRFTDSDSSEMGEDDLITPLMAFYTPDGVYQIFSEYCNSIEKQCARCSKLFKISGEGEYLSFDSCTYHWGKLSNVYNGKCFVNIYSCCQGEEFSEGCSKHALHVWNGSVVGINGPYSNFVHTKYKEKKKSKHSKVYAIDCEMSYTGLGLEVTKVTVVGYDGSLVYEHFVQPQAEIIDYNTRFSGVSEKDFSPDSNNIVKTFSEVQTDLLNLFDADTILIGHGLDNDLRVLRLVHKTIVDTSVIFSHSTGYPYRRSLKNLTKSFLKRDIQCDDSGHSSFEDSRACLELMMWKIRKDLRHWNYQ